MAYRVRDGVSTRLTQVGPDVRGTRILAAFFVPAIGGVRGHPTFKASRVVVARDVEGIPKGEETKERAQNIERRLGIPEDVSQFGGWPGGKRNLADEIGAAWIVYTAVLASWIFVAGAGLASLTGKWPWWLGIGLGTGLGIGYLFVLVLALSRLGWGHDFWGRRKAGSVLSP